MKSSRIAMILVLTVSCQAAITLAEDVRILGTSENTMLLPLPYLDVFRHTYWLSDNADDQFAWARASEISTNNSPSLDGSEEEGTDFEPILFVPGRSLVSEMQGGDALPQWESYPEGNVLPLDPWLADGSLVGTIVMQPTPFMEETTPSPLQLGISLPIQIGEMAELSPLRLEGEDPNRLFTYMYTVPSLKYGNLSNEQGTVEIPALAARFEMWKDWTLNDYRTAFRYISQQFAQVDWAFFFSKIQQDDSIDQGSFYMQLLLKDLN